MYPENGAEFLMVPSRFTPRRYHLEFSSAGNLFLRNHAAQVAAVCVLVVPSPWALASSCSRFIPTAENTEAYSSTSSAAVSNQSFGADAMIVSSLFRTAMSGTLQV